MASPVSSLFGSSSNTGTSGTQNSNNSNTAASSALSASGNEQMFLQLLVSQLQNQDPTNPVDGTQFVSELSQFSEVEQLIAIRSDIEGAVTSNSTSSTPGNSTNGTTGSGLPGTNPTGTNPTNTQN